MLMVATTKCQAATSRFFDTDVPVRNSVEVGTITRKRKVLGEGKPSSGDSIFILVTALCQGPGPGTWASIPAHFLLFLGQDQSCSKSVLPNAALPT